MKNIIVFLILITMRISGHCQTPGAELRTFTNPLFTSGADPWIIYKDGFYYYTNTSGSRLFIRKARNLDELKSSESVTIWTPPEGDIIFKRNMGPGATFHQG